MIPKIHCSIFKNLFVLTTTLLAIVSMAMLPARSRAEDIAVVIGINDYPQLEKANLEGCVPDAKSVEATLKKLGFTIKRLTNSQATKQQILATLRGLRSSIGPKDRFVFYFAGHGSHSLDYKCYLLAADADEGGFSHALSKQELDAAIGDIPTNKRTVLLDACHAEGLFRSKGIASFRSRYHQIRAARGNDKSLPNVNETDNNDQIIANEYCGFAACLRRQPAAEMDFGDSPHGIFTYYLTRALEKSGKDAVWDDIVTSVSSEVAKKMEAQQTPVFGPSTYRSRRVFDGPDGHKVDPKPNPGPRTLWDDYTDIKANKEFIQVKVDPNKSSFKIPQKFDVKIKVGHDGYLIVLNKDSSGKVFLFSPDPNKTSDIDELIERSHVHKGLTRTIETHAQDEGTELVKAILFRSKEEVRELVKKFPKEGASESELRDLRRKRTLSNDGERNSDDDKDEDKDWTYFTSQIAVDILKNSNSSSVDKEQNKEQNKEQDDDKIFGKRSSLSPALWFPGMLDSAPLLAVPYLACLRRKTAMFGEGEVHV